MMVNPTPGGTTISIDGGGNCLSLNPSGEVLILQEPRTLSCLFMYIHIHVHILTTNDDRTIC